MKLPAPAPFISLDEQIATLIMGVSAQPWSDHVCCPYCGERGRYCGRRSYCVRCSDWYSSAYKDYSLSLNEAFEVVETMRTRFGVGTTIRMPQHYDGKQVMVEMNVPSSECQEWGADVAEAICKCAIKSYGKFDLAQIAEVAA